MADSRRNQAHVHVLAFTATALMSVIAVPAHALPPSRRCERPSQRAVGADRHRNQQETDVDCGGPTSPACPDDAQCVNEGDCRSGMCVSGRCACVPFRILVTLTSPQSPAGAVLTLDYPPDELAIPGRADDARVRERVTFIPEADFTAARDRSANGGPVDDRLTLGLIKLSGFEPGRFAEVTFCLVGAPPAATDLHCAADTSDTHGHTIPGATCSAAVLEP